MKTLLISFSIVFSTSLCAQVETDKPIVLTGADGERYVTGLELPVNNVDAASKEYVDAAVSASGGGTPIQTLGTGSLPTMMSAFSPTGGNSLLASFTYCRNLSESSFTDWRVPTLEEVFYFLNNDDAYAGITNPTESLYFTAYARNGTQGATGRYYINIVTNDISLVTITDTNSLWRARCVR